MKILRKKKIAVAIAITFIAVASLLVLSSRSNKVDASLRQEGTKVKMKEETQKPLAIYNASLPNDISERSLRIARSSRYDVRAPEPFEKMRSDTKAYSISSHWWLEIPALPTAESDVVVIGKIKEAKGFVSNDLTGAYSEFEVGVREILKNDGRLSNNSILTEREGADVQLPDGRIIRYEIAGQGLPKVKGVYVLFLKYNEQGKDYEILTGYELYKKKVVPLDNAVERFAAYKDFDENVFFSDVRAAIVNPQKVQKDERKGK